MGDASDPKKPITWSTVRYMMCEVMFGGRITDDLDRRLMNTYGEQWGSDNCCFTEGWTWKAGDMRYSIPDAGGPETGGISLAKSTRSLTRSLPLLKMCQKCTA